MMGSIAPLAATSTSKGFNPTTLILILVVVVGFYLLMIRPQQRRRQQAQQQQSSVQPGARVRTTAGMYATVVDVDGDDVVLEVAPGVEVRYMRRAIMDVVGPSEEDTVAEDEDEDEVQDEVHDEVHDEDADEDADTQAPAEYGSTKKD